MNIVIIYIKLLEKQEQDSLRNCREKKFIKIRAETNELEIQEINETKPK
jgi:hypothetical protein